MSVVRFAAIQMNSTDDVVTNLGTATELLDRAVADGAALAVLPENFACIGAHESDRIDIAEPEDEGPIQDFLAAAASRTGLWIVGGTIPLLSDDPERPYAACLIFDASGRRAGRYDKIHLFDVGIPGSEEHYRESADTHPGRELLVLDTPWGRLGVAVCYDLRFPELFRRLSMEGMDFLTLPAAFTAATGRAHWYSLVRARAIENLCYVVAAAQTGTHAGGRQTHGRSMIVGPWGDILAGDVGEGDIPGRNGRAGATTMGGGDTIDCISADIDPDRLAELRRRFPVLSHGRFRITGPIDERNQ